MTRKELDARLSQWLFKIVTTPLLLIAPHLRTNYRLQGDTLTFKRPCRKPVSLRLDDFDEIGAETNDQGPFIEDMFLILKRGDLRLRIGEPHPVFRQLTDRFNSLEQFDWRPFLEAQGCSENRYFLCWRRPPPS